MTTWTRRCVAGWEVSVALFVWTGGWEGAVDGKLVVYNAIFAEAPAYSDAGKRLLNHNGYLHWSKK